MYCSHWGQEKRGCRVLSCHLSTLACLMASIVPGFSLLVTGPLCKCPNIFSWIWHHNLSGFSSTPCHVHAILNFMRKTHFLISYDTLRSPWSCVSSCGRQRNGFLTRSHCIPRICVWGTLCGKGELRFRRNKVINPLNLQQGDYLGLSRWVHWNHKGPSVWKRKVEKSVTEWFNVTKTMEEDGGQGMHVQDKDSLEELERPWEPPERKTAL